MVGCDAVEFIAHARASALSASSHRRTLVCRFDFSGDHRNCNIVQKLAYDDLEFVVDQTLQDQVCEAAIAADFEIFEGVRLGFCNTSGLRKGLARAIPLHLNFASEAFGTKVSTFHFIDCSNSSDARDDAHGGSGDYERSMSQYVYAEAAFALKGSPGVALKWIKAADVTICNQGKFEA